MRAAMNQVASMTYCVALGVSWAIAVSCADSENRILETDAHRIETETPDASDGRAPDAAPPASCVPGSVSCSDERWLERCSLSGTSVEKVDCAASGGGFCRDGVCLGAICHNGTARVTTVCQGATVHECSDSGGPGPVVATCADDEACVEASNFTAECRKKICVPGQKVCLGTSIAECNDTGTAYLGHTMVPCVGQLCKDGKCVPLEGAQG